MRYLNQFEVSQHEVDPSRRTVVRLVVARTDDEQSDERDGVLGGVLGRMLKGTIILDCK